MTRLVSDRVKATLGLVAAVLLLAPSLAAQEEAAARRSSLELFRELSSEVATAVEEGRLPASIGDAASGLAFELERELLRSDAEIGVARLEAARFEGEPQQQALDRLIAAAAARERLVLLQLGRLEELVARPAVVETEPQEEAKEKRRGLSITFEPADPTEDP